MSQIKEARLLKKMDKQILEWLEDEPHDDWWNYQREYQQALAALRARDAEIEAYQEQIRQLQAVNQRWAATAGDDETEIEALGENNEPA